jgi:signal transduction histidine kinase
MVNLLSNAFKFSPRGSTIDAKIKYIVDQNIIKLKVKDNGIGMNDDE